MVRFTRKAVLEHAHEVRTLVSNTYTPTSFRRFWMCCTSTRRLSAKVLSLRVGIINRARCTRTTSWYRVVLSVFKPLRLHALRSRLQKHTCFGGCCAIMSRGDKHRCRRATVASYSRAKHKLSYSRIRVSVFVANNTKISSMKCFH